MKNIVETKKYFAKYCLFCFFATETKFAEDGGFWKAESHLQAPRQTELRQFPGPTTATFGVNNRNSCLQKFTDARRIPTATAAQLAC